MGGIRPAHDRCVSCGDLLACACRRRSVDGFMKPITVGITTRNREAALARALVSLGRVSDLIAEVLVFDDGSDPPAEKGIDRRDVSVPTRVVRDARSPGYIVGRNQL